MQPRFTSTDELQIGMRVQLNHGSLEGATGEILETASHQGTTDRCVVLFRLFGQRVPLVVDVRMLDLAR